MPTHHTPGVYFEWQDRRFSGVSLARADIAGFVGVAVRGPVSRPVRVESWNQFTSAFGTHTAAGFLPSAVEGFFANGGRRCWVVRVASASATAASWELPNSAGKLALTLQAASPGAWAKQLTISAVPLGAGLFDLSLRLPDGSRETWRNLDTQKPFVDLQTGDEGRVVRVSLDAPELWQSPPLLGVEPLGTRAFLLSLGETSMTVTLDSTNPIGLTQTSTHGLPPFSVQLLPQGLSVPQSSARTPGAAPGTKRFTTSRRFAGALLNDRGSGSELALITQISDVPDLRRQPACKGGTDGLSDLIPAHFEDALATLGAIDEVAILAMPDICPKPELVFRKIGRAVSCTVPAQQSWPDPAGTPEFPPAFDPDQVLSLQQSMVDQCALLKDRVAILDFPSAVGTPDAAMQWRGEFNSSYAGCYYPWLVIPDPLQLEGIVRSIPPSGHMAGIFARVEQTTGVHKPPANEIVEGAEDVVTSLGDIVHGLLNDEQVNVIRPFSGRRVRVAGGRTVSDAPAWRFLNVRRLFIAIERSVRMNLQWIAFEPSNPGLWLQVDRVMRSFLEGLWMRGLLDGDTRDAAYSVTCDATTNPGPETDNGRVICEIGVLPPWPAEFVTVRIGITEGGVEMLTPAEVQVA